MLINFGFFNIRCYVLFSLSAILAADNFLNIKRNRNNCNKNIVTFKQLLEICCQFFGWKEVLLNYILI